jgi:hypothetical protein
MENNGKIISLFESLSEGNGIEYLFLFIPSKPQFSLSQNWEEYEGIKFCLMKFLPKLSKCP